MGNSQSSSNIGKGLASLLWLVEPTDVDRLAPIGCVGELLVEGPALARGYLNDIERTRESFIQSPVWTLASGEERRFYKTGDLMRYNSDGTMDYIGRKDTQVKIHGQRVELSEIEYQATHFLASSSHVAVQPVKLLAHNNNETVLAAFISSPVSTVGAMDRGTPSLLLDVEVLSNLEDLAATLTRRLPRYMVPNLYIPLDFLPTNASGKIDRRSLVELVSQMSEEQILRCSFADIKKRTPRNAVEENMLAFWTDILKIPEEKIGIDDSFFHLGGDSVAAMKLVARARRDGVQLTVAEIFRTPVLWQMASRSTSGHVHKDDFDVKPFALLPKGLDLDRVIDDVAYACNVDRAEVQDVYPTTALQEGLMALTINRQGSYVFQKTIKLPPTLDVAIFKASWEILRSQNVILRTRIIHLETLGTLQAVLQQATIEWQSGSTLEDYLLLDRQKPFEYGATLARYALVGRLDQGYYLVWTLHHALYDGWSMSLLLESVERLYKGLDPAASHRTPFNSFVRHVASPDIEHSKTFWSSYLRDANATTFPQKHLAYTQRSDAVFNCSIDFSRNGPSNITTSTIIRAAWSAIVARYSDTDDVVFGTTLSGRNSSLQGIDTVVGPTIATVPVHAKFDRSQTIEQYLKLLQEDATAMMPYEHCGLQNIAKWCQHGKQICDFQNILVVHLPQARPITKDRMGLLSTFNHQNLQGFHTYPLVMECTLHEDSIDVTMSYDHNMFSGNQVERIAWQFEGILHQLNSESKITTLASVNSFSQFDQQLVKQWNGEDLSKEMKCIHDLFDIRVEEQPHAQAVCSWDGTLTYSELDFLSTKLALRLQSLGVTSEVKVPCMFDKSKWAVVAQLAILRAGGVLVSLEPHHPAKRRRRILADIDAKIAVTPPEYVDLFQDDVDHVVVVDERIEEICIDAELNRAARPDSAAIIIYTSGSTGEPKGVVLEHASICTGMQAHGDMFHVGRLTRVMNFSSYVFDVSIQDVFTTLTRGGCCCIPSKIQRENDLAGAIRETGANWICITPTVARLLEPNEVPTIQTLILVGEPVMQIVVDQWKNAVTHLYNGYGPTESTLYCAVNPDLGKKGRASNVGRGLYTKLWVVEPGRTDHLAPVGTVGELIIEGPLLARGYLNDQEKTNKSFIVNPEFLGTEISPRSQRKMYRTGDLVQYNDDGSIDVLGRMDSQIKLHGQRLELGEVEHHLTACRDVHHAMALLFTDNHGIKRIMAVIALRKDNDLEPNASSEINLLSGVQREHIEPRVARIRETLDDNVPQFMVPTVWAIVHSIPRNTSDKIDRAKICAWASSLDATTYLSLMISGVESKVTEPVTAVGAHLRKMIGRVLNRTEDELLMSQSFLHLGGDSITAMQLVARCRAEAMVLTVKDILKSRSLTQLSTKVKTKSPDVTSKPHDEVLNQLFDLSPIQQMYFESAGQRPNQFNQSFLLKSSKHVSADKLRAAVEAIICRHAMLRARYVRREERILGSTYFFRDRQFIQFACSRAQCS